ncbi:threonine--tRNA ligase [Prevotella nigrescens]|jgi:threonine--tRNA ligase|uniref:Threonine--tRNA ligase n=2 Tax=Prevotella nigrescens TaxID=28133 RepID=V8CR51_9BACT|nr:threonine--tRNA ligase [Prevotella nigrescens]ETD29226.1 threonyl-tRNA synthetase [Prevotella nigrescens CC14M]MBF1446209.1 threonine--tRNA ligase [Prevotella nigrescens]MBW4727417.1 threonine--tRNA ligase [Prevotella nigrescens]QUB48535.1 threonine--tRNA ligase [Prevotella nigrescens]QUB51576.1 threonine--tRNA ligase [Prevotella nigrescens]
MVKITFPDGSVREYEQGVTGLQIAESISPALARNVVSCGVNGVTTELNRPINEDATIALYKFEDEEGKHTFWHSSAHLLAEALKELYPGIQFGFGPAIENGFFYDVQPANGQVISESDFPKIEQKMLELAKKDLKIVRRDVSKADAIKEFSADGQEYKVEHIVEDLDDGTISTYSQGNFTDLCRGPHLMSTGAIKAVKLTSVAGAFWRGDAKSDQLTRIYGITFPKKKMLDEYLAMLEEAKKRDHRKIGKEMELFTFSERVGKGLPIWLPKGTQLRLRLQEVLRKLQRPYHYQEVITPGIGGKNLYVTSGHYAHYGKDSFQPIQTPEEDEEYMLKPMNCPHHCEVFSYKPRSYKELPLRIAEFGTVFRYEKSGELHGLTRVRTFTQDDAHIFVRPEQLRKEFEDVIDIILKVFATFGFNDYEAQISLRDPADKEKYIGSDKVWEESERAIKEACKEKGLNARIEIGEAAFYGPKLDFMVKDAIGRRWQLGTIQVDYNLPNRFKLEYTAENNTKETPVMIHRAPFGSLERFTAVLIEHTAGHFPLWLTPDQVAILPISEKYNEYAQEVKQYFDAHDVRALVDERNEKIGRKIRDNELKRIPYMVIVGEKEMEGGLVSMRQQGGGEQATMTKKDFVRRIQEEVAEQTRNLN